MCNVNISIFKMGKNITIYINMFAFKMKLDKI